MYIRMVREKAVEIVKDRAEKLLAEKEEVEEDEQKNKAND